MEGSPAAVTTTVADVRKEVLERLDKGGYPQWVLDQYSDNPFDQYTKSQLEKMKAQVEEALQRKVRL
jgi:chemotaxis methyl-accepting protein methylase